MFGREEEEEELPLLKQFISGNPVINRKPPINVLIQQASQIQSQASYLSMGTNSRNNFRINTYNSLPTSLLNSSTDLPSLPQEGIEQTNSIGPDKLVMAVSYHQKNTVPKPASKPPISSLPKKPSTSQLISQLAIAPPKRLNFTPIPTFVERPGYQSTTALEEIKENEISDSQRFIHSDSNHVSEKSEAKDKSVESLEEVQEEEESPEEFNDREPPQE